MKHRNSIHAVPILFITLLMFPGHMKSQTYVHLNVTQAPALTANAGPDYTIDPGESLTLGGTPAASGGTGSLTYFWDPPYHIENIYLPNPVATPPGNVTYTLLVYDERGCTADDKAVITVIGGTGMDDDTPDRNIILYPNPSSGAFTLEIINGNEKEISISVMTMTGQIIHNEVLKGNDAGMKKAIDLSGFPKGTYVLHISSDLYEFYRHLILN
jgi:Secretion system C-terminal sorting domain